MDFPKVKNNQIKIADLIFERGDNDSTKMKQHCHYLRTQKHFGAGLQHTVNILLEIRVTATHHFKFLMHAFSIRKHPICKTLKWIFTLNSDILNSLAWNACILTSMA